MKKNWKLLRILRQEKDHYSQNWRLKNLTNDSNKTSLADCYPFMLLGEGKYSENII